MAGPVILRGVLGHGDDKRSQYRRRDGRDPGVKAGLVVEPGTEVVLSVDKRDRRKASLVYRPATRGAERVAEGDRSIRFKACFDDEPTGWPGGFVLAGPRCVRIVLDIKGQSEPVRRRLEFGRDSC
ncbi:MAG: hypothetical protein M3340_08610 [Actinomycetota bacterium]|nr:hypothetical protein [Actinomycetota bacterium]